MFILKIVVAVAFLLAGGAKLAGAKPLADQFVEFGLPRIMMYLVGVLEIAGAIGLFIEPLAVLASLGLGGLMLGAIANHIKANHRFDKTAPSLGLLIMTCVLAALMYR